MGTLRHFNLSMLVIEAGVKHFVETGTGIGTSLSMAAAVQPPFKRLLSCEMEPRLSMEATRTFAADDRVAIFATSSMQFLTWACRILPHDERILFWLDAHFPGADYGLRNYDYESDQNIRLPLEQELRLIHRYRPHHQDIIFIDDLRIYEDDNFGSGPLPDNLRPLCPTERNIKFIEKMYHDTHEFHRHMADEGYLCLIPRTQDNAPG